ncbi:MAG: metal-sulfur cluster assembly factor [Burkholderiales bacterium]
MTDAPVPDAATVWGALRTVFDPEIGESVVDLGLVYRVECGPARVAVDMTMTTPACPAAGSIAGEAEEAIRRDCPQAREVNVAVVFEPPWTPERMSEQVRKRFGW